MKSRCLAAVVCALSAVALSAHAGVDANFNGTVPQEGGQVNWQNANITFYDEGGYRFTADSPGGTFFLDNDIHSDSFNVDDDYLFNQNASVAFTITRVDGAPFTFESFRAGGAFGASGTILVVGNLQAGGNVQHQFNYVPGGQTGQAFPVINLPGGFGSALTSVTITRTAGNFSGFDDFSLTVVPAPAALALLAGGFVMTRRRRRL